MKITRKGYYTISGPDGVLLTKPDGSLRQATTRDDCYEYVTEDGREGVFTIHCPNREVDVGLLLGQPPVDDPVPLPDGIYISNTGNDSGTGESGDPWQTISKLNSVTLGPGTTVYFNRGDSWSEDLSNLDNGSAGNPIIFTAYGSGNRPLIRSARIDGAFKTFEDIDINVNQQANTRALDFRNGNNLIARRCEIQNGVENGLQVADCTSIHFEDLEIHDFMKGSYTGVAATNPDAHGISLENTQNVTAAGTIEIYRCSGDSIQVDPGRSESDTIDFTGATCTWWTGPLASDFNAGWTTGTVPGENAIDTKVKAGTRMAFAMGELIAYGWQNGIPGMAALNIKEGADFTLERGTFYDCERAFRVRGGSDNPDITIQNCVVYDCNVAVRAEDSLDDFKMYNCTFGSGITTVLEEISGGFDTGLDVRNNAFIDSVPATFTDASNVQVTAAAFVDEVTNDYRHLDTATTLDEQGNTIAAVTIDRLGVTRTAPYSIGAYEVAVSPSSFAYFDTLAARGDVNRAVAFRSQQDVEDNWLPNNHDDVTYDASVNAMQFRWPEAGGGNNIDSVDVILSPEVSSGKLFITWDERWGSTWASAGDRSSIHNVQTFKNNHVKDELGGGGLMLEVRKWHTKVIVSDENVPAGEAGSVDIRGYYVPSGERGPADALPGQIGDFIIPIETWHRYFLLVEYDNTGNEVSLWATKPGQAPAAIYTQAGASVGPGVAKRFQFQHNTSSDPITAPNPSYKWVRNIVILDGISSFAEAQSLVTQGSME